MVEMPVLGPYFNSITTCKFIARIDTVITYYNQQYSQFADNFVLAIEVNNTVMIRLKLSFRFFPCLHQSLQCHEMRSCFQYALWSTACKYMPVKLILPSYSMIQLLLDCTLDRIRLRTSKTIPNGYRLTFVLQFQASKVAQFQPGKQLYIRICKYR